MSGLSYLYTEGCQHSAEARDRPPGMSHASRTICESLSESDKMSSGYERNSLVNDALAPRTGGTRQSDELCHSS